MPIYFHWALPGGRLHTHHDMNPASNEATHSHSLVPSCPLGWGTGEKKLKAKSRGLR